jgi:hypothetical protein
MINQELISRVYSAFNQRGIDATLVLMSENVSWPKASEGGRVVGKQAIRDYWSRQWAEVDPRVDVLEVVDHEMGKTDVMVHQLVKNLKGDVLRLRGYRFKRLLVVGTEAEILAGQVPLEHQTKRRAGDRVRLRGGFCISPQKGSLESCYLRTMTSILTSHLEPNAGLTWKDNNGLNLTSRWNPGTGARNLFVHPEGVPKTSNESRYGVKAEPCLLSKRSCFLWRLAY